MTHVKWPSSYSDQDLNKMQQGTIRITETKDYRVISPNGKQLGDAFPLEDGEFVFQPAETNHGAYSAAHLRDIADHLDILSKKPV